MGGHSLGVCTRRVLTSSTSPDTPWEGTMIPEDNHHFYLSLHLSLTLIWPRGEGESWCLKVFTSCALRCISFLTHSEALPLPQLKRARTGCHQDREDGFATLSSFLHSQKSTRQNTAGPSLGSVLRAMGGRSLGLGIY